MMAELLLIWRDVLSRSFQISCDKLIDQDTTMLGLDI